MRNNDITTINNTIMTKERFHIYDNYWYAVEENNPCDKCYFGKKYCPKAPIMPYLHKTEWKECRSFCGEHGYFKRDYLHTWYNRIRAFFGLPYAEYK